MEHANRDQGVDARAMPTVEPPPAVSALIGGTLCKVIVDDALTLCLRSTRCEASVRIDNAGMLRDEAGLEHPFNADEAPRSLGCVLQLLQHRVLRASVQDSGELVLDFGFAVLTAIPHDHQVSWSVSTSEGYAASCLAEGAVVWR